MKKSIYILFCFFMFLLLINPSQSNALPSIKHCEQLEPTAARPACEAAALGQSLIQSVSPISAETVSTPDQSDDPRNIMNSESVDFNKETLQLHKRIAELENLLTEANTKNSDLEGKLANAVSPTVYAELEQQYKNIQNDIRDAKTQAEKTRLALEANIESLRAQLAIKTNKIVKLRQVADGLYNQQQKLTQNGKDPYDKFTVIRKKYYDDMMETIKLTCNPHTDQKYVKTACILGEVDTSINYGE